MKKTIHSIVVCFVILACAFGARAQEKLWGYNSGVYSLNKDGSDFTYYFRPRQFDEVNLHALTFTSRHYLQGVIRFGEPDLWYGASYLFQVAKDGDEFVKLYKFPSTPEGRLVELDDQYLYGVSRDDHIFKINTDGTDFTNLLDIADDNELLEGLIKGNDNKLYGIKGDMFGNNQLLFSYDPATNLYNEVFHFVGLHYQSNLLVAPDGSFYGVGAQTSDGNVVVFKISADGSTYDTVYDFNIDYAYNLKLVYWPGDYFVGLLEHGNPPVKNVIFKLSLDGSQFTELTNRKTEPEKSLPEENLKIYNSYLTDFSGGHVTGLFRDLVDAGDGQFFQIDAQYAAFMDQSSISQALPTYKTIYSLADSDIGGGGNGVLIKDDAGELFGFTQGLHGIKSGTIFKLNRDGIKVLTELPFGKTIEGNGLSTYDNWVYGTVSTNVGHIIRVSKNGDSWSRIHQFNGADGRNPYGKVIDGGNGFLYGMTFSGGANNQGVIYRLHPDGTSFQKLYDFTTATGKNPYGSLLNADGDYLFGLTAAGGANNLGVIFKIKKDGSNYTKLYDFDNTHGSKPFGNLYQGSDGSLYGMTYAGGTSKRGVIFRINSDGSDFQVLKNFPASGAGNPKGDLIEDGEGYLFGVAGSVIFKLKKDGSDFQFLHGEAYGEYASLVLLNEEVMVPDVYVKNPADSATNVNVNTDLVIHTSTIANSYTVDLSTTPDFSSVIFSQTDSASVFDIPTLNYSTTYYARVRSDIYPLYGKTTSFTTQESIKRIWGSLTGVEGAIYHINLDGSGFVKAFDTQNGDSAFQDRPENIIRVSDGSIIGTTSYGGAEGWGNIFRIDENGLSNLHNWPQYAMGGNTFFTEGNDGFIYGAGSTAGPNAGHIFRLKPNGDNFQTVSFAKYGFSPAGYLTTASNGTIYGMSIGNGPGWIYTIKPDLSGIEVIYTFSSSTGKKPLGELTEGPDGFLYGPLTQGGVYNRGTVFKISLDGQQFIKLHDFNGTLGNSPKGQLAFDNEGNLYGVTSYGGSNNKGVLYKMKADGSNFSILHHFNEAVGPEGHITIYHNIIYGSSIGGSYDGGFLFSVHTDGSNYHRLVDFPIGDYSYPTGRLLLIDEQFNPSQNISTSKLSIASNDVRNAVNENLSEVELFPNPSSHTFTIEVKDKSASPVELKLYDVNGAMLHSAELPASETFQVGEDLKPGVYILRVKKGNRISTHRLIKK
jgi:uncharacterized repeat protein (TIGR03803 family)